MGVNYISIREQLYNGIVGIIGYKISANLPVDTYIIYKIGGGNS